MTATTSAPLASRRPVHALGIPLESVTEEELLCSYACGMLVFHNLDTVYKAKHDPTFRQTCTRAERSVIDSQVLRGLVSLLWARPVDKVAGSDFLPAFCRHHADDDSVRVFLLGAGPGVAEDAGRRINASVGREMVVGTHSPSFTLLGDPAESAEVARLVNQSGATVLAVGLGAPKQELWMARNRAAMPGVRRLMAVGATLDFEAGTVKRAPRWMTNAGLEWCYRLLQEPRRLWRRYLVQGPQVIAAMAASRLSPTARDREGA